MIETRAIMPPEAVRREIEEHALEKQFHDMEQQRETATLGMWIFLMTELLLFGALFISYTVYRYGHAAGFMDAGTRTSMRLGGIMTALLITSSFAMATAVHAAKVDKRKLMLWGLALTILFGVLFLGIKFYEYYDHYQHHEVPGIYFDYPGRFHDAAKIFFFLYFMMTGLHAVHMTIGLCIVGIMLVRGWRGAFTPAYYTPVEMTGLYWHFVDIVWIFLFPLFYLLGRYH
ncbi:MAG: cytochrome c oxidase subunit 3 family protein [Pyrinomonadaceae bacterium]